MRKTIALLGALALAGVLAAGAAQAQPAQGEPYRIGIILPMTGATADYGTDFNRGALLAEEEINAAGGIGGRKIELTVKDDKSLPDQAVLAFNELKGDSDAVIGSRLARYTPSATRISSAVEKRSSG